MKKRDTFINNSPIKIYINKIENIIMFRIKKGSQTFNY